MARSPIESPKAATFDTNDKRAQYARLVVFNFGQSDGTIPKGAEINEARNADLQKAWKAMVGGNYLEGPDGVAFIQKHSKKGSTTGRELTTAYAAEVRPFIRRGELSEGFGRRTGNGIVEPKAAEEKKPARGAAKPKGRATRKPRRKVAEVTPVEGAEVLVDAEA